MTRLSDIYKTRLATLSPKAELSQAIKAVDERHLGDCSNPSCPYRVTVLKHRKLNTEKVRRQRARKAGVPE